jgi:hypothetical protein
MYWRQFEMLPLGLASKLGFHPSTKAILVAVLTSPPKQPPVEPWQFKIEWEFVMHLLDYAFYMYWR